MSALRQYQVSAVEEMRTAIDSGAKSVLLVAPTGSGKTKIVSSLLSGEHCNAIAHRIEIQKQILSNFNYHGVSGIVCGVHSALAHRAAADNQSKYFFIDEAHHIAANSYQKLIHSAKRSGKILIGATATPYRLDGAKIASHFDAIVETSNASELANQGYLAKVEYFAPLGVDFSGIKLNAKKDFDKKQSAERVRISVQAGDIASAFSTHIGKKKAIVYCINQEHVERTLIDLREHGVLSRPITSRTTHADRAQFISEFDSGEVQCLVNCEVLTEGTDMKNVGAVLMLRPTISRALYKQMIGRGMRPDCALTVVDLVGNFDRHGDVMGESAAEMIQKMGRVETPQATHGPISEPDSKERLHVEIAEVSGLSKVHIPSLFMDLVS